MTFFYLEHLADIALRTPMYKNHRLADMIPSILAAQISADSHQVDHSFHSEYQSQERAVDFGNHPARVPLAAKVVAASVWTALD